MYYNFFFKLPNALEPTVLCKLSNVLAAAARTSGDSSQSARRTVGTKEFTNDSTISLEVEDIISESPTQTPWRFSGAGDDRPEM